RWAPGERPAFVAVRIWPPDQTEVNEPAEGLASGPLTRWVRDWFSRSARQPAAPATAPGPRGSAMDNTVIVLTSSGQLQTMKHAGGSVGSAPTRRIVDAGGFTHYMWPDASSAVYDTNGNLMNADQLRGLAKLHARVTVTVM